MERYPVVFESDDPHAGRWVAWMLKLACRKFGMRARLAPTPGDQPQAWEGWVRVEGGPWVRVCTATTPRLCSTLLNDHGPAQAPRVERRVLPRGERPKG